jgi:hypothetical protein
MQIEERRWVVLSWDAELEAAKKEIAELENRISVLSEELQAAQGAEYCVSSARPRNGSPGEAPDAKAARFPNFNGQY